MQVSFFLSLSVILTYVSSSATYAASSSNTTLRVHLDKQHRDEYIRICKQNKWEIKITSARKEQGNAVSPLDAARTPFSKLAFIEHLVRFVVANDQVSKLMYLKINFRLTMFLPVNKRH